MDVLSRYQAEQAKLQDELDGKSDIHIDVPKDPEVDPKIYRDVEALLFRGFLYISAEINDVDFTFKSLNHHEFDLLQMALGHRVDSKAMRKFYNYFLAYGIIMIDGHNVLLDRERWLPNLAKFFDTMPAQAREKVIRAMSELNRRASSGVLLTEAFAMETASRFRWAQLQGLDLSAPMVTGVPGSSNLGLNWGQLSWRAMNLYEDRHEAAEREWENAKFIGACFAGKGVQKIYNQDNTRRQKEREDRAARKDKLLRHVILGVPLEAPEELKGGQVIQVARTVEQLADQLEKSLRGEEDWHDHVVSSLENKTRQEQIAHQERLNKLAEEYAEAYGDQAIVGRTEALGLTPSEVADRLLKRQQQARNVVRPEQMDEKSANFMHKWGLDGKEAGK